MTSKSLNVGKHKAEAVLHAVGSFTCIGRGVALAVLLPNPITFAVLGGLAVLTSRRSRKKMIKKIEEKTSKRNAIKADFDAVESGLKDLKQNK